MEVIKQEQQLVQAAEKPVISYTPEQVALIKSQIAPKATDDELKLFLYQCQRTGLDALSRQIYAIHRNTWNPDTRTKEPKMTIQTSIDGFRVVAERSKLYAGQAEPVYEYEKDGVTIRCCKVRVYKFNPHTYDRYEAAVGVAYWKEYAQKTDKGEHMGMWGKMPHIMIAKVAEAVALRKAFPQDLSGLYTEDEMAQADMPVEPQQKKAQISSISLTDRAFGQLLERMRAGDIEAYEKAKKTCTFSPEQQKQLQDLINSITPAKAS